MAKITNVMKLVSSSKLKSVEEALFRGRAFGESILNAIALPPAPVDEGKKKQDEDSVLGVFADATKKHLCVVVTTDRGLCGAVNSSLSRSLRKELNAAAKAKVSVKVITMGDKGRMQIARDYAPIVARTIDGLFDKDPIFPLAANLAAKVVAEPYDLLTLYYNHYENQAKFHNTFKQIPQMGALKVGQEPEKLKGYEVEPEENPEAMVNLQEYGIASALFYAMLETVRAAPRSQRAALCPSAPPPPPPPPSALTPVPAHTRSHTHAGRVRDQPARDGHGQRHHPRQGHGARAVAGVQPRAPGQDHHGAVRDHWRRHGAGEPGGGGIESLGGRRG